MMRKTIEIYAKPTKDEILKFCESAFRNTDIAIPDDFFLDFSDGLSALMAHSITCDSSNGQASKPND